MMGSMMRRAMLGDGSTLSLDFTTGVLDPRLTFTRSTSGTYIGSDGLVKTATANTARFDYDPTTLAPRGLLIEGSANNFCTWSQDFGNAVWVVDNGTATNPSVSSVSQTAPDGASSVNRITFNKTGGTFSRIRHTLSGTAGATYTFSVWMKANTASGGAATQNVGLRIGADTAGFNCVVTTTWKRFSYSYALSGTDAAAQIMLWDNIVSNDETADVLVWGAQLETGSGASSYIPTGASTGNRAADSLVIQDGAWRNTANIDSTWYVDGALNKMNTAFNSVFDVVGNVGFTERNRIFISATGSQVRFTHFARSASVNPDFEYAINQASPNGYVYGSRFKVAATFDNTAGENRSSWNGATSNGTTAAACTTTPTYFTITVGSGNDWHFRSIKYWPISLPQTTLNGITTL